MKGFQEVIFIFITNLADILRRKTTSSAVRCLHCRPVNVLWTVSTYCDANAVINHFVPLLERPSQPHTFMVCDSDSSSNNELAADVVGSH